MTKTNKLVVTMALVTVAGCAGRGPESSSSMFETAEVSSEFRGDAIVTEVREIETDHVSATASWDLAAGIAEIEGDIGSTTLKVEIDDGFTLEDANSYVYFAWLSMRGETPPEDTWPTDIPYNSCSYQGYSCPCQYYSCTVCYPVAISTWPYSTTTCVVTGSRTCYSSGAYGEKQC